MDFSVRPNRVLNLMKRSKYNGSMASLSVVGLLTHGDGVSGNRVLLGNGSLLGRSGGNVEGVEKHRITVVFRRPVGSLGPYVEVRGRLARTVLLRGGFSGRRTRGETFRMLGSMNVPRPSVALGDCPRRLSNNVYRHIVVTVTVSYRPRLLVTSRPAATLSIAVRTRVLRLVRSVETGGGANVLVVARSLNIITRVYSEIIIVCTNQVMRRTPIRRLFTSPGRPCARNLVNSMPGLKDNIRSLPSVPKDMPSLSMVPGKYGFTPEYGCTVSVYRRRRPRLTSVGRTNAEGYEYRLLGGAKGRTWPIDRPLLSMGGVGGAFRTGKKVFDGGGFIRTMGSMSFSVCPNRAFSLMNRSNYNGSAANGLVSRLVAPSSNRV